jgi:hypothetical protein
MGNAAILAPTAAAEAIDEPGADDLEELMPGAGVVEIQVEEAIQYLILD